MTEILAAEAVSNDVKTAFTCTPALISNSVKLVTLWRFFFHLSKLFFPISITVLKESQLNKFKFIVLIRDVCSINTFGDFITPPHPPPPTSPSPQSKKKPVHL